MKNTLANFSRITEYSRPQVTICWAPQRFYDNHCASFKIISVTPERLLNIKVFEKKAFFLAKKLFRPSFSRIMENGKPQGTKYRDQQGIVTVFVQVII